MIARTIALYLAAGVATTFGMTCADWRRGHRIWNYSTLEAIVIFIPFWPLIVIWLLTRES